MTTTTTNPTTLPNALDTVKVGDGATFTIHSDSHACTVIKVTKTRITVQRDKATLLNGPESGADDALTVSPGGFAAHVSGTQRYRYEPNPDGEVLTFSRRAAKKSLSIGEAEDLGVEPFVLYPTTIYKLAGHPTKSPGCFLTAGRHEHYDYNF